MTNPILVILGALIIAVILAGFFAAMARDLGWRYALACCAGTVFVAAALVGAAVLISAGTGNWP